MVTKCANPSCSERFGYRSKGKLFQLEPERPLGSSDNSILSNMVEYFWLCASCSTKMTLHLDEKGAVVAEPFSGPAPADPQELEIITRRNGMILRSIETEDSLLPL